MVLSQRFHLMMERWLPEKRLFLRTDHDTRFVRLGPGVQIMTVVCLVLVIGWTIIASAIIMIDSIGSGNLRDQARRDQLLYETRLNELAADRDARAEEAAAAQMRFNSVLNQVSEMQSQLLASEEQRRELERGIEVMQASLQRAVKDRDAARGEVITLTQQLSPQEQAVGDAPNVTNVLATLDVVTDALEDISAERDTALLSARDADARLAEVDAKLQVVELKTDQIFRQLEDAMTISVKPLDTMFRKAGLNTNSLLQQVRRGYSGQGGALTPISFATMNDALVDPDTDRANNILTQLDRLNVYRIAAEKAPFSLPVKGSYRFTSGYGPRWGRMHHGTDFAAAHGAPIYATADGVVTHSGWGSGYGRYIKIQHEFGIETRYAHLSRLRVKKGQRVSRGQRIGDMGNSGRSTGTHLHYEVRVGGKSVNPMIYIKAANDVF